MKTSLKTALGLLAVAYLTCVAPLAAAPAAQTIAGVDTSKWFGFNLLEKFTLRGQQPYLETDFQWIAELGFNFARLPIDYRCYTQTNDWLKFKESVLQDIDQAIAFGKKHGVHVSVNLHRAPGYCINPPKEATDLWTDETAQAAFAAHWAMFARRYKGIPSAQVSFNLLNEPANTTKERFVKVFSLAIEAIHQVDPDRLIIVDGMDVGSRPVTEFLALPNVIQATRGYHPSTISHYKANWMKGSDQWPEPTWPMMRLAGYLYGPEKADLRSPLTLQGTFPAGTEFVLRPHQLSVKARLTVKADGQLLQEKLYDPAIDPADWQQVKEQTQYRLMQVAREIPLTITLKAAARELTIENVAGDWLKCSELSIRLPGGTARTFGLENSWGRKHTPWTVTPEGRLQPPPGTAADEPLVNYLKPWREISQQGETVFVGEWGAFNKTPHPVTLAWMEAWMKQWQTSGYGWALWNFRGTFGILDSGRADVQYEEWHGHKLDRAMLTLLQKYARPGK
jgi:aryl-phospho-beta-D-glucosidase BglC (GH1 family)